MFYLNFIQTKYNPAGIVDPSSTLCKVSWLQSLNLE